MPTTMIFVPGNNPAMVQNAGILGADAIIFDLEDAVSQEEKDAARILVRNALTDVDYGRCMKTVRINSVDHPCWIEDIAEMAKAKPDAIVLPKAQRVEDINMVQQALEQHEHETGEIGIIPLIETAEGVERVFDILCCSPRIKAVIFGAEDYTADIGATRTKEGAEIMYARCRILNAAAAAGVEAIDTPFTDVDDLDGLRADVMLAKSLGFAGKALISPRHCKTVKEIFAPTDEEIEYALRVIRTIREAEAGGKGVVSLDGKMIDAPIVLRAKKVLQRAGMEGGSHE
jgi:citrate lyase subunit beta/citryl-CoA lyase